MDNLYLYPDNELIIKYQNDWQKELYHKKILEFKKMPIGFNKIIFLGNSITEGLIEHKDKFNRNDIS